MLRFLFLTFPFCFFPFGKMAAQPNTAPMKIGHISPEDLAMTTYEADTSAPAVVLCDYGISRVQMFTDGPKLRGEFFQRIKILKRSGFDYGDVSIPFYSYRNKDEFYFNEGMVHLPNGEKIELGKKDIFIEEVNKYWSKARFTFPKLEEGCIIEYSYFLNSESIYELTNWFFQQEIPVRYSEIRIDFPDRFAYTYLFQGNEGMAKIGEEEDGTQLFAGKNGSFRLGKRQFVMENAPAMKEERYITTMDDYRARIRFQLAEVKYNDGRIEKIMTTWDKLKEDLDHHEYFGQQYLKKNRYKGLTNTVLPLAAGQKTERDKMQFFYDYLLREMEWNGRYSMATRRERIDDIFTLKKGSSAELNLMLLVLLREAGISAEPLITSTRSNGKMYEDYPLIDQFNHTMVRVNLDGEAMLLDVTDPLRPPGYPSVQALNERGLIIHGKSTPEWVDITPPKDATDLHVFELSLNEDGALSGTFRGAYKGYNAVPERRHYRKDATAAHWKERLSERFPEVSISEVRTGGLDAIGETLYDTLDVSIGDAAQVAGDFIYLSPVLYSGFLENPFKLEERLYPVDFPYPFTEQHLLTLKIPDGYVVEDLPESARFALPENAGLFFFSAEEKTPGTIKVSSRLLVRKLKLYPHEYPAIKELFDLMVEKCGEQIVLRKG